MLILSLVLVSINIHKIICFLIKIEPNNTEKKEAIADFQKAISLFYKESVLDEIPELQQEIKILQEELQNTPWWQMRVF